MPLAILDVDPRTLHVPPSRMSGADPYKLLRQTARFGASSAGMPPPWVYRGADEALMLYNGVTRATRIAKLAPGASIRIEVVGTIRGPVGHLNYTSSLMARAIRRGTKRPGEEPSMASPSTKCYLPWIVALLLGGLLVYWLIDDLWTRMQIGLAEAQTAIFEQMRQQVADSDAIEVGCLEYVVVYYPSGTKQTAGTPLDRVVERARRSTVREIIATLRTKTGEDFGDDPRRWIEGLKTGARE